MRSSFRSLSLFLAVAVVCSRSAQAQSPCSRVSSSPDVSLPRFAQILPPGNLSLGGSDRYLYAMTQWGFARASLADPAHPSGFSQVIIVEAAGSSR